MLTTLSTQHFKSRLAKKYLLMIVTFSSAMALISTAFQLNVEYRSDIRYVETQLDLIENSYMESLTDSLWAMDDRQVIAHMNNMLKLRDIVFLEVFENDKIIYATKQLKPHIDITKRFPIIYRYRNTNEAIGMLKVHVSYSDIHQRMLRRILVILLTQGLKTFFVSLFILYMIHRQVIRYILKISEYARNLKFSALDKPLDINRNHTSTSDEIDILVESINTMRRRLSRNIIRRTQAELAVNAFFDQSLVMLFICELKTNCLIRVNSEVCKITGLSKEKLISKPFLDLVHPQDQDTTKKVMAELTNGKSLVGYLCRHLTIRGECRIFEWHAIADTERKLVYAMAQDITLRKLSEENLLRYEHIISSTNDLMSFVDKEYRYQAVNNAYLKAHMKNREDIVGVKVERIMGKKKFFNLVKDKLDRALSGEIVQYQSWFDYVGFGRRYMDVTYHPFRDHQGDISGVVVGVHDLTKRKQTEDALQLSLEKYEKTFQTAPIWVVLSTIDDGKYIEVNDTILKTTGYRREEMIGKTSIELGTWVSKEDRDRLIAEVKKNGSIRNMEVQRKTKSGEIIDTLFSAATLQLEGKAVMISVTQNITEQKKVDRERQQLQTQLHQAQKIESVGRLAGGVAHDLNNLLSPILGYSEMLLMDVDVLDPRRETLQEIVDAAMRAKDLVHQLLAFSRKQTLAFSCIDMNVMIRKFETLLRRTIREDILIKTVLAPSAMPIMGDTGQLEQVIMNLSVNAQDAMPDGGKLTIKTSLVVLDEVHYAEHEGIVAGTYVLLTVSDTGCGMDSDTLDNMFEPFFTTKEKGYGTGLGLATVYGIVKQHNGHIRAYSAPGRGAVFKVYLPVCNDSVIESESLPNFSTELIGTEHVLLVEDNEQVRNLAYALLDRTGYTVLVAKNGPEALFKLKTYQGPLHLLLTDVVMPDMNGRQLFKKVAAAYPVIKVLYMSGYTENVISDHGVIDAGINFLPKPFTIESLLVKVRQVLDHQD